MAQRFGGRHSPGAGGADWAERKPSRAGARSNALFIAPVPLVFRAFGSDPTGLLLNLLAFGMLMAAAWLTREGLRAHEAYDARTVARRPALPRKILGAALTGLGLGTAGMVGGELAAPVIFGVLGFGLHLLAFGPDPLSDKGAPGADAATSARVARAVDEAEAHLEEIRTVIDATRDKPLKARVESFIATARRLFRAVEQDPRDLRAARRWLGVYLLGARDATEKFATLYARNRDPAVRQDYIALLDDLEDGFARRTETMLLDDRQDMDIEIEVLRERLERESLAVSQTDRD